MRVEITAAEWRVMLGRAREVGAAMGAERAAVVAARAAVEALGLTVPVLTDEVDAAAPPARSGGAGEPAGEPVQRPRRDLRLAARQPRPIDGYCGHCASVYGAAALAVMADGNRLCPVHGTVVTDVAEVAEGRYRTTRPARTLARPATERCGAPVGGHPCALDVGHDGRHDPRPQEDEVPA